MTARLERPVVTRSSSSVGSDAMAPVEHAPAPFSLRCGALLIDYIVLAGIVAFSTLLSRLLGGGARAAGGPVEMFGLLSALVVGLIDFGLLTGWRGQTIGKWATGIRIERPSGRPLGWGRSLVRHFVGYPISLLPLGLGFLLAAFNTRGRALHDMLAGTIVVRDERPRNGKVR